MATLEQLITRVSAELGEPVTSSGWFTPANVTEWLNRGIRTMFNKIMTVNPRYFGEKSTPLSFQYDVQEYSLPVSAFEVRNVEKVDGTAPRFLSEVGGAHEMRGQWDAPGEPIAYYWRVDYTGTDPALRVGLLPAPNRAASDAALVWYVPYPRMLVNLTDTPDLPEEVQDLAVLLAVMAAKRSDSQPEGPTMTEFNAKLSDLLRLIAAGRSGDPSYITYINPYT